MNGVGRPSCEPDFRKMNRKQIKRTIEPEEFGGNVQP